MREIVFVVFLIFLINAFTTFAFAESKTPGYSKFRVAAGYVRTSPHDVKPAAIEKLDEGNGFFGQVDFGEDIRYFHVGYTQFDDTEVSANFNNGGLKDTDVKVSKMQYGIKIILPWPYLNFYGGGGYTHGTITFTDVTADEYHKTKIRGWYYHAGIDLMLPAHLGLRFTYQVEDLRSNEMAVFSNRRPDFNMRSSFGGILFHF